jgi:tetratricopeptide (TPR) repeat protein
MKYRILLFLSFFILSSCLPTKQVQFESVFLPEKMVFEGSGDILICNLSYLPEVDNSSENDIRRLDSEEQEIIDTMINHNIFNGLFTVLMDSPQPKIREASYFEARAKDTTAFLKPLSIESVNVLCEQNDVNYLIVFEYYSFSSSLKWNYSYYDNGYLVTQNVKRKLLWRIYEADKGLIKEDWQSDTLYIERNAESIENATNELPKITDLIRDIFWDAGVEYAKKISPYWDIITRSYYPLYNKSGENISQDLNELLLVSKEENKSKSFMALYNLAVLAEKSGEIKNAIENINKALKIKPNSSYGKYYLSQLKNRDEVLTSLSSLTQE